MLTIIMGPSGSGKTTLLNAICRRNPSSFSTKTITTGDILFNGAKVTNDELKGNVAYVVQSNDHLNPLLTVKETIIYASYLRLPPDMKKKDKIKKAHKVIDLLGLKECSNTLIGNEMIKGISGGEKRRVCIAIQILNNPSVILLDEPTTGLDSFTSSFIMKMLSNMSKSGRTVIATVHQPPAVVLESVDNILLMAKGGTTIFNGSPQGMLRFFSSKGLTCPSQTNPADFAIDQISIDTRSAEKETESLDRLQKLLSKSTENKEKDLIKSVNQIKSDEIEMSITNSQNPTKEFKKLKVNEPSIFLSYSVILLRMWKAFLRNPRPWLTLPVNTILVSILLILIFGRLDNSSDSVTNRIGIIFRFLATGLVGTAGTLATFPQEQTMFLREYSDGVYSWLPFSLAYLTFEVVSEIIGATIYVVIVYYVIDFQVSAKIIFMAIFCAFSMMNTSQSYGIAIFSYVDPSFGVSIYSLIINFFGVMCGLFTPNLPQVYVIINYISSLRYVSRIAIINQFENLQLTCGQNEICQFQNGQDVLDFLGFQNIQVDTMVWNLAIVVVVTRLFAWFCVAIKLAWKGRN